MKNKKILSWAMYDWANSAFATTIMAGFFPVFLKKYWGSGIDPIHTTAQLGTTLSLASFGIALVSPFLGVLSDSRGSKKIFLFVSMLFGVAGCIALGALQEGQWVEALIIYGLSYMAFNASCVFYDSLLPSIARGTEMDYASSIGYSLGYLGGGLLFLLNVMWYLKPEWFGFSDGIMAVKASFISVGIWWFIFTFPLMKNVPEPAQLLKNTQGLWKMTVDSVATLKATFKDLLKDKNILTFMVSYWLFIDGVYTVITMAVDFGIGLGLESKDLISALLITQFIGFPCAWIFGLVTPKFGCRKPILFCIFVYSVAVILATGMSAAWHFYALAAVIGMVQGGVQSLSRSLFGNMVPAEKAGEYFAFFNLVGKFASIFGPLLVAVTVLLTGDQRLGMMGLLVLFIVGGYLLFRVREPRHLVDGA